MALSVPPKLKAVAHYVKIGNEQKERDPALYYWCVMYAVNTAMKLDKTSPECKKFLVDALTSLEQTKAANADNEAVTTDMVAQAHVEEVALKFFVWADTQDRSSVFDKNVVKAFYTAGHLFDLMDLFGGPDEETVARQKYAKWKAAYIHNCLKSGETPVPGPAADPDNPFELDVPGAPPPQPSGSGPAASDPPGSTSPGVAGSNPPDGGFTQLVTGPKNTTVAAEADNNSSGIPYKDVVAAQKACKYASSALDYEDVEAAVKHLKEALRLLEKD